MLNTNEPVSTPRLRRVLVVEDDQMSRTLLRVGLQKQGFEVVAADGVESAQGHFAARGFDFFDCMVTDYWMPGRTGLDLLIWLHEKDPTLASIVLTSEGEKKIISESFRKGATDFLEKPIDLQKLTAAAAKAIEHTRRQREMARSDSAVKNLGHSQMWMVQSGQAASGKLKADICFHPKLSAGGDFFGHFPLKDEKHCYLLSDVSGHDLRAAYISAYFHGIFRGMLTRSATLPDIFGYFNDFLIQEWNQAEALQAKESVGTSLATAALLINLKHQEAVVFTCGSPLPLYSGPDGRVRVMGENPGPPLGWFPDLEVAAVIHSIAGGGTVYLWTDGLEDLAQAQNVQPLCLAFALHQAKKNAVVSPLLERATDDILFAAVQLPSDDALGSSWQPLLVEHYRGDQGGEIDGMVSSWRRHLNLALPELGNALEHDVLLATREALLNALRHGCQGQAGASVRFQISFDQSQRILRIWVEDPGAGYQFDYAQHEQDAGEELIDEHRGLIFITHLAHVVKFERGGATLILDFKL